MHTVAMHSLKPASLTPAQSIEQYTAVGENTELRSLFPGAKYRGAKHAKKTPKFLQPAINILLVFEENLTLTAPVCLSKCQEDYTANTGIIISFLLY